MSNWRTIVLVGGILLIIGVAVMLTARPQLSFFEIGMMTTEQYDAIRAAGDTKFNLGLGSSVLGAILMLIGFLNNSKA